MDNFKGVIQKYDLQLPLVFKTDDFKSEVNNFLTNYINDLQENKVSEIVVKRVKRFRRLCSYTLSNYLKGIHSNAFKNFEKAVGALQIENSPLLMTTLGKDILFRGRENKEEEDYTADQMYHIPLNKRHIISTQRYSFPGLPCIYAGASVYTCWMEMNRPAFERFQVATLQPSDEASNMKVYDLSNIPQRLSILEKMDWFNYEEYFLYWPLLALCSVKVNHEASPFKPEYIFPQFLLEHILENKNSKEVVGIKYASVKVSSVCRKQFDEDWHTYVNYVLPSHSDNMEDGKCPTLEKRILVRRTRSGRELQILTRILEIDNAKIKVQARENEQSKTDKLLEELRKRHVYTRDGKKYSYALSVFGMIELAMQKEEFDDIDEDSATMIAISDNEIDKMF